MLYSKLDLIHACQQIVLIEESQKLTKNSTQKGLFANTLLYYGVSSALGIFQRVMEQLVQGTPMVAVYPDDIIVCRRTPEEARVNF